ncbi:hypothetical protein EPN15_05615 [Patescibacteria group bacterium]|nr:MAG: hypothetical protein EPN15_05615 [Patescibacteria group bacterium]
MENQTIFKKYLFVIIFLALLVSPVASNAAALPSLVPDCAKRTAAEIATEGPCNVCDAIGVGINITKIMLGTLGSAALLVFVYGGFLMLTSRGHSDQVQKGKDALINAVKGVIIVLASWMVINYGLAMFLVKPGEKVNLNDVKLFDNTTNWATVACTASQTQIAVPDNNSSGDSACKDKAEGTTCGTNLDGTINATCDGNGNCISLCETTYGSTGYSCRSSDQCQESSIKYKFCPGGNNTVCCLPK